MQKGQALKMLEDFGHPSFPEPVTEGPSDTPTHQCEKHPGVDENESDYERSGKNLGHVSNALHGLDAHDVPTCLRSLLGFFASCSAFNCRLSLRIFLNRGEFEPNARRPLTEGPERRFSEVGILSLLRHVYLTAGAWSGWRFSIALAPRWMEAGRAQSE